ncbi:glycosyltransferase [Marivivens donghaensis]|uniref:Glycosyltransferase n=1 Tax=Marivivens donghaensis TaxID=1699413 RepID=A0ABX0W1Y4_9RHOB|nr:glycosyltransferase [Marivivens donghaensis]NIY74010.1 glycosyltransferase [Marivivens donghaensis]
MLEPENHIALAFANFGTGGAQRAMTYLANELVRKGWSVQVLVFREDPKIYDITRHKNLQIIELGSSLHEQIVSLNRWQKQNSDIPILATQENVIRVFLLAGKIFLRNTIVIREANRIGATRPSGKSWLWAPFMKFLYTRANGFISLSSAVQEDLRKFTDYRDVSIPLIKNAIDVDTVELKGQEELDHEWFSCETDVPVVIGVGRLVMQKDFANLVSAVALARKTRRIRLLLLGTGQLREQLLSLGNKLNFGDDFQIMEFQSNPYKYMKRSDVYVLSSKWEGSPNTLLEAMALGMKIVACDCPSGPRELITNHKIGKLVDVGDAEQLAIAILQSIAAVHDPEYIIEYTKAKHDIAPWAEQYIAAIGCAK